MPYAQVRIGFTGELSLRDTTLLLERGITRKALRALVAYVLRMMDATHFRHCLPNFPATPDFRALMSEGEHVVFLSWLNHVPGMPVPPSWQSDAPHLVQWPHAAIIRWISLVYNVNWLVPLFSVSGVREQLHRCHDILYWYSTSAIRSTNLPPLVNQQGTLNTSQNRCITGYVCCFE